MHSTSSFFFKKFLFPGESRWVAPFFVKLFNRFVCLFFFNVFFSLRFEFTGLTGFHSREFLLFFFFASPQISLAMSHSVSLFCFFFRLFSFGFCRGTVACSIYHRDNSFGERNLRREFHFCFRLYFVFSDVTHVCRFGLYHHVASSAIESVSGGLYKIGWGLGRGRGQPMPGC